MQIVYIPGEDNTVADALSWVPDGAFPGESIETSTGTFTIPGHLSMPYSPLPQTL